MMSIFLDIFMILAHKDVFTDTNFIYHHLMAMWAYFYVIVSSIFCNVHNIYYRFLA